MGKTIKCPLCYSAEIAVETFNPDDHGLKYYTYYKCRNCGRETEAEKWEVLSKTDLLIIDNRFLTEEVERLKAEATELQYIVEQFSKWTAEGGCVKAHHTDFPCWWECNRVELELDDYCDSDDEIKHKCWVEYYRWKHRKARGEE